MPDRPDNGVTPGPEEEQGGPVKTFLEHLEDLRWTLVKCASAVGVGFFVCLIAVNYITGLLLWPLHRAGINHPRADESAASIYFGTNYLGQFRFATNQVGDLKFTTNLAVLEVVPLQIGPMVLIGLRTPTNLSVLQPPRSPIEIVSLGPAGGFIDAFQVAFYGALVFTAPMLLYFLGQFILPALKQKERRWVFRGLGISSLLFFTGVAFCYFFLLPMVLAVSYQYSTWQGFSASQWRAEEYISFVCKFMLGMGLGFEEPLVLLTLVKLGILSVEGLKKFRPYMVILNLVLGAVITTPEVVTQIAMFIPLQLLYEISILIASYWARKERKAEEAAAKG